MSKRGCIGYFRLPDSSCVFAISGLEPAKKDLYDDIKRVLGRNCVEASIDYSFTKLSYIYDYYEPKGSYLMNKYHNAEDNIYNKIKKYHRAVYIFSERLNCTNYYAPWIIKGRPKLIRNFSCVERKLIGYYNAKFYKLYKKHIETIIVNMNPCYFCLPCISKVKYIDRDNHKVYRIQKSNFIKNEIIVNEF